MDFAEANVTSPGCDMGGWLACCRTCREQSAGQQLGTTARFGHHEGARGGMQLQQSKVLLQHIQHACNGSDLAISKCLQVVSTLCFARHGNDLGALHTPCRSEYRSMPLASHTSLGRTTFPQRRRQTHASRLHLRLLGAVRRNP